VSQDYIGAITKLSRGNFTVLRQSGEDGAMGDSLYSFFRVGKTMAWGDVALDSQRASQMMQVHLKQLKCDPRVCGA
jgi:hypothetical protein